MASTEAALPRSKRPRIREVDMSRAMGIMTMVLAHSFLIYPIDILNKPGFYEFNKWITDWNMELLNLVSGSCFYCINYKKYISRKTDRIFIPYLVFGFIALLLHASASSLVNQHNGFMYGIKNLLLTGGNYWFLYTIFMIFVIYPWLIKVFDKPWKEVALVVLLFAISDLFVPLLKEAGIQTNILCFKRVAYHMPYFILGRYAVKYIVEYNKITWKQAIPIILICIGVYYLSNRLIVHSAVFVPHDGEYVRFSAYYVAWYRFLRAMAVIVPVYIFIIYLLRAVDSGSKVAKPVFNAMKKCSQYSLQIYLFDAFWMTAIRTVLCNVLHITNPFVILFFMVTVNLTLTVTLCDYVLKRNKTVAWLTGLGRRPWYKPEN